MKHKSSKLRVLAGLVSVIFVFLTTMSIWNLEVFEALVLIGMVAFLLTYWEKE